MNRTYKTYNSKKYLHKQQLRKFFKKSIPLKFPIKVFKYRIKSITYYGAEYNPEYQRRYYHKSIYPFSINKF